MSEFVSSKELFINDKKPPVWDRKKSYFDQDLYTLAYYAEEFRKIQEGVTIGGYFIHPWLYFHINFFKTPIPTGAGKGGKKSIDVIMNPPLDDNTLYVSESYAQAEKEDKGIAIFGARGVTKSTWLASISQWTTLTQPNGVMSIVGGDQDDLNAISRLIQTSLTNAHPFFHMNRLKSDWESEIKFGLKDKNQEQMLYSSIAITNADKGSKKKSEKGAGLSPSGFIADEIGKWNPIGLLQSALPSYMTPYGQRLVHVLAGTTGNRELSKDAKKILTNPEEYRLLLTNWDTLERNVPEEHITWKHSRKERFSVFMPGQMSYRLKIPKIETNLADFLGKPKSKALKDIKLNTTNWEAAINLIKENINSLREMDSKEKQRMYYPTSIDDVFLTEGANPFPTTLIRKRIKELEESGDVGKDIDIINSTGKSQVDFVSKKRAEVSHGGGEADAPIILFGDLPQTPPPRGIYVSGLDDYKLEQSDTDSLGSMYVIKRRGIDLNTPCETIAASYTARPYRHKEFHRNCEKLIETWDAECCMESIDVSFAQYLDERGKAEQLLAPAFSFARTTSKFTSRLNSRFGIMPNGQNNEVRFNTLIDYCKEEHLVDINEDGQNVYRYGVEYIDDIDLLKEMLNYKKGGNFDRIVAFSHALVYARELDKKGIRPDTPKSAPTENYKRKKVKLSKYGMSGRLTKY